MNNMSMRFVKTDMRKCMIHGDCGEVVRPCATWENKVGRLWFVIFNFIEMSHHRAYTKKEYGIQSRVA